MSVDITLSPVAYISSPWKQKFAIPRQPCLVPQARGVLTLQEPFNDANTVRGLEAFSHLWLLFHFHATAAKGWQATVAPPRLGGTERVGVFASRSMFRPNSIGLSVVKLEEIEIINSSVKIHVSGVDLLDGTPILDIKPYLPYADALNGARADWACSEPDNSFMVSYSQEARSQLASHSETYPELADLLEECLRQDPRPAQLKRKNTKERFAVYLYDLNIRWEIRGENCVIISIEKA